MKRMVKNGDLIDISEDGSSATFGGNLKVGGTIIANGEVRGGDVSASKFYLGTEEMPLVKANPAGDATGTLEKIKIGDVAYKVGGGSDYTAGSNIKISEAKEISVNQELTGIDKIKLAASNDYEISSDNEGIMLVKNITSGYGLANIKLKIATNPTFIRLLFYHDDSQYQNVVFDTRGFNGTETNVFLTRSSSVPLIPKEQGTYLLKGTIDQFGRATYSWEKQTN